MRKTTPKLYFLLACLSRGGCSCRVQTSEQQLQVGRPADRYNRVEASNAMSTLGSALSNLLLAFAPTVAFHPCGPGMLDRRHCSGHRVPVLGLKGATLEVDPIVHEEEPDLSSRGKEETRQVLADLERQGGRVLEGVALDVPRVVLKKGKARLFFEGNPIVFGGAVDCVLGKQPEVGETVLVADSSRTLIGWGVFNPISMYRVRIFQNAVDVAKNPHLALNVEGLLQRRVREAVDLRRGLGVMPESADSNKRAFRLFNSEGDGLSGLVIDVFADAAVVQSFAAWTEGYRSLIEDILQQEVSFIKNIIWQKADGALKLEGIDDDTEAIDHDTINEEDSSVTIEEHGLEYIVDLGRGQKTGFYCDQRENRAWLASLPLEGKRVLDLCTYTGGFALNAARAGASKVIGVDSSERAINTARLNAEQNGFSDETVEFHAANALEEARRQVNSGELFDVVVLDPPKLAPNIKALQRARGKYKQFQRVGIRALKPGGILLTCSCSGAVTRGNHLVEYVNDVAKQEGRRATLMRRTGAAADHVISSQYKESEYFHCLAYTIW